MQAFYSFFSIAYSWQIYNRNRINKIDREDGSKERKLKIIDEFFSFLFGCLLLKKNIYVCMRLTFLFIIEWFENGSKRNFNRFRFNTKLFIHFSFLLIGQQLNMCAIFFHLSKFYYLFCFSFHLKKIIQKSHFSFNIIDCSISNEINPVWAVFFVCSKHTFVTYIHVFLSFWFKSNLTDLFL